MNPMVRNLEGMLAAGKDGALLRYTLGKAYADEEQMAVAREHLRKATALDAEYPSPGSSWARWSLALAMHRPRAPPGSKG